jgi:hypothetical protein
MSLYPYQQPRPLATSADGEPGLLTQVGMAGSAAVITVSFIHPIDVVKVRLNKKLCMIAKNVFRLEWWAEIHFLCFVAFVCFLL